MNLPSILRLRELKAEAIGQLVAFSGTVTRTSDVRPELFLAVLGVWTVGLIVQISSKIAGSPHLQAVRIHLALIGTSGPLNVRIVHL